jgi:hypothetical protein
MPAPQDEMIFMALAWAVGPWTLPQVAVPMDVLCGWRALQLAATASAGVRSSTEQSDRPVNTPIDETLEIGAYFLS